jgi:hypothetical protein
LPYFIIIDALCQKPTPQTDKMLFFLSFFLPTYSNPAFRKDKPVAINGGTVLQSRAQSISTDAKFAGT